MAKTVKNILEQISTYVKQEDTKLDNRLLAEELRATTKENELDELKAERTNPEQVILAGKFIVDNDETDDDKLTVSVEQGDNYVETHVDINTQETDVRVKGNITTEIGNRDSGDASVDTIINGSKTTLVETVVKAENENEEDARLRVSETIENGNITEALTGTKSINAGAIETSSETLEVSTLNDVSVNTSNLDINTHELNIEANSFGTIYTATRAEELPQENPGAEAGEVNSLNIEAEDTLNIVAETTNVETGDCNINLNNETNINARNITEHIRAINTTVDRTVEYKAGLEPSESESDNYAITFEADNQGAQLTIDGTYTETINTKETTIQGNETKTVESNLTETVEGNVTEQIDGDLNQHVEGQTIVNYETKAQIAFGKEVRQAEDVEEPYYSDAYILFNTNNEEQPEDRQTSLEIVSEQNLTLEANEVVVNAPNQRLDGSVEIVGDTTIESDLEVQQNTDLQGTLDVAGATELNDTLDVAEKATFDKAVEIKGAATSNGITNTGIIDNTGNITNSGTLENTGKVTLKDDLNVKKNTSLEGTLEVQGETTTAGITNTGSITNTGNIVNTGNINNTGDVSTTGVVSATTADISGDETVSGKITTGTLESTGNASLKADATVDGVFTATGKIVANADSVNITKPTNITGNTSITGSANITGPTNITGNATISGTVTAKDTVLGNDYYNTTFENALIKVKSGRYDTPAELTIPHLTGTIALVSQVDAAETAAKNYTDTEVNKLDTKIENLKSVQNVVEVVEHYSELASKSAICDENDCIQVIQDENAHNERPSEYAADERPSSIYRLKIVGGVKSWDYVGSYGGDSYTKTQTNVLLNDKADKIATVSTIVYDTANRKFTKTINAVTTDIVTLATLKTDLALDRVDNKSTATLKSEFTGQIAANNTEFVTGNDVYAHTSNTNNPHAVTKAQVGLGNVADLAPEDLPISDATQDALDEKVDKVAGYGLSKNDFTDTYKNQLDTTAVSVDYDGTKFYKTLPTGQGSDIVSISTLKTDMSLNNVDNTSDADKPISTATQAVLDLKENLANKTTVWVDDNDQSFIDDTHYPTTKLMYDTLETMNNNIEELIESATNILTIDVANVDVVEGYITAEEYSKINERTIIKFNYAGAPSALASHLCFHYSFQMLGLAKVFSCVGDDDFILFAVNISPETSGTYAGLYHWGKETSVSDLTHAVKDNQDNEFDHSHKNTFKGETEFQDVMTIKSEMDLTTDGYIKGGYISSSIPAVSYRAATQLDDIADAIWNAKKAYAIGDIIFYNRALYICEVAVSASSAGNTNPATDTTRWTRIFQSTNI